MIAKSFLIAALWACPLGLAAATPSNTPTASPTWTRTVTPTLTLGTNTMSPTRSATPTPTRTATPTNTQGPSSSATASPLPGSHTTSPTNTATWTPTLTATPTRTGTVTASGVPTAYYSPSATPTASPFFMLSGTPTSTVTPTQTPAAPVVPDDIDDFEGGSGWTPATGVGPQGGTVVLDVVAGCPYGSGGAAQRCHGGGFSSINDWASLVMTAPAGGCHCSAPALSRRALSFRIYPTDLVGGQLTVTVRGVDGSVFYAVVTVVPGQWNNITIATPDNQVPGTLPQFTGSGSWASCIGAIQSIDFGVSGGANSTYDFTVDDLAWGVLPAITDAQVGTVFGASISDVQEAQSYGLDQRSTWILIVLSRHCGCRPHTIMGYRSTMSWGQIAVLVGSDWGAILGETDAAIAGAGLEPEPPTLDEINRVDSNGPPNVSPRPSPTPYGPNGPMQRPVPGGC